MKKLFLILILFGSLLAPPCWSAQSLRVSGHPNYPPYMWNQDGTLIGIGVELAKIICNELEFTCETLVIDSWQRVQENVRNGEIDLVAGAYINDERRTYMDYSIAYMNDKTSIFVHKDRPFKFASMDDLIGKRGIAMHGESYGQKVDTFATEKLQLTRAYTAKSMFENLRLGRVDYILWGHYPWRFNAHVNNALGWCIELPTSLVEEGVFLAFSKKSDLGDRLPEINQIITRLKDNGTIKRWHEQFINLYMGRMAGTEQ